MMEDIKILNDTRDALHAHMARYISGKVDADSCGKVWIESAQQPDFLKEIP